MSRVSNGQAKGIYAALSSAFFLGLAPVFGKLSISHGMSPMAVVALRTILATALLFTVVLIYNRRYLYIYPAGLLGCFLAGGINGIGSLLYYSSLGRINASLGQLIYSIYPLFVALWLWLDHQKPSRLTIFRLMLVLPALYLLIGPQPIDLLGVLMMLVSVALYALHLPINQRVLYDMPGSNGDSVHAGGDERSGCARISLHRPGKINLSANSQAWGALIGLTLVTFFSRLTLFLGVKHLGGLQTALLGLGELLITLVFSHFFLNEGFTAIQWAGVALLVASLVTVRFERPASKAQPASGWLGWLRSPGTPSEFPWQPHN